MNEDVIVAAASKPIEVSHIFLGAKSATLFDVFDKIKKLNGN